MQRARLTGLNFWLLFYYAGHGVQVGGRNFLMPVSANPTKEADDYLQMVDTAVVLSQMNGAGTKLNIVVLYFASPPAGAGAMQPAPLIDEVQKDFDIAQKIDRREIWEAFLQNHPSAMLASVAKTRLDQAKKRELALATSAQPGAPPPLAPTGLSGNWSGTYYYPAATSSSRCNFSSHSARPVAPAAARSRTRSATGARQNCSPTLLFGGIAERRPGRHHREDL